MSLLVSNTRQARKIESFMHIDVHGEQITRLNNSSFDLVRNEYTSAHVKSLLTIERFKESICVTTDYIDQLKLALRSTTVLDF